MTKEIIEGYLIDEYGNLFSLKRNRYLKPYTDKDGYLAINLYIGNKQVHRKIHRLVAEAFVDGYYEKPCIDHIDRNRKNNYYKNLRCVTPKENSNNPNTIEHLKKVGIKFKKLYGKPIYDKLGNRYVSIIEASRKNCIPRSSIQRHLKQCTGEWFYE